MNKYIKMRNTFEERYYTQLIGTTITGVSFEEDEFSPAGSRWVTLTGTHPEHGKLELQISQDEEGNGPGFLFGLPVQNGLEESGG